MKNILIIIISIVLLGACNSKECKFKGYGKVISEKPTLSQEEQHQARLLFNEDGFVQILMDNGDTLNAIVSNVRETNIIGRKCDIKKCNGVYYADIEIIIE